MTLKRYLNKKVMTMTLSVIAILIALLAINYFYRSTTVNIPSDLYLAQAPISYATAIKKSAPAVVSIQTIKDTKTQHSLGSGVIIDDAGHIITNYHVVKDTEIIRIKLADGRKTNARIVGIDPLTDLAVLQINFSNLPVIKLGNSSQLQVGDVVLAIGNPLGLNNTVTQGIVSSIGSIHNVVSSSQEYSEILNNLIQTDAAINLGNSGGALINAHGDMIGINTAIVSNVTGSQGIGFAIPSDTAKDIMLQLISNGKITRGWLGAQLSTIPDETRQYLKFQQPDGIYVQNTIRNSPAQKAGILPGDIITKINNSQTQDIFDTIKLISGLQPNKSYPLEIFREGKNLVYNVKFSERP